MSRLPVVCWEGARHRVVALQNTRGRTVCLLEQKFEDAMGASSWQMVEGLKREDGSLEYPPNRVNVPDSTVTFPAVVITTSLPLF